MKNLPTKSKPDTFETVLASLKETNRILSKKFNKTDKMLTKKFDKTDKMLSKKFAETDRIMNENFSKAEERFQKLEQLKDEVWEQIRETEKIVKENSRQIGGMGNSKGDVAETYFINSFTKKMYFAGQNYDSVSPNLSKKVKKLNLQDEYDLVLYNCTSVVIIEIKYKADLDDIENLLKKSLTFKNCFLNM